MAQASTGLGSDIATRVWHVVGMEDPGPAGLRQRLPRSAWWPGSAHLPPPASAWQPGGGPLGGPAGSRAGPRRAGDRSPLHHSRGAGAAARGAAVTRPTRCVVPSPRGEPPDRQARPRLRERRMQARPAWGQASRGLRREEGLIVPPRRTTVRAWRVARRQEAQATLPPRRPALVRPLDEAWRALAHHLADDAVPLAARGQAPPAGPRRPTIPRIGPVRPPARIAAVGAAPRGRPRRTRPAPWHRPSQ
jgi:hypothetical protein